MNPPPRKEGRQGKQVFSVPFPTICHVGAHFAPRDFKKGPRLRFNIFSLNFVFKANSRRTGRQRQSARLSFSHCNPASELLLEAIHSSSSFQNANFNRTSAAQLGLMAATCRLLFLKNKIVLMPLVTPNISSYLFWVGTCSNLIWCCCRFMTIFSEKRFLKR